MESFLLKSTPVSIHFAPTTQSVALYMHTIQTARIYALTRNVWSDTAERRDEKLVSSLATTAGPAKSLSERHARAYSLSMATVAVVLSVSVETRPTKEFAVKLGGQKKRMQERDVEADMTVMVFVRMEKLHVTKCQQGNQSVS